ncbi:MAG: DUF4328 domain-containing protein [Flavobacteriales bacterium]|nr:DUF4328 domain-containing protein [Flavobacteriales bacterium]
MSNKSVRSNEQRSKWAIISLYAVCGGSLIFLLSNSLNFYAIYKTENGLSFSNWEIDMLLFGYSGGMIIYGVTYLICAVFFLLWFIRSYRNIQILLPKSRFRYKPWAAIVCWFIPVWNLFGPYHVATDLFDRTERYLVSENIMELRPRYDIVKGVWWGLWIVSGVIIRVSQYHIGNFPDSYVAHSTFLMGFLLSALCALFAVKMIKNYSEMELLWKQSSTGTNLFKSTVFSHDNLLDSNM